MKNIFYIIILVSSITMYSQNPISGFVEYTIVSTLAPDTLKVSKNKKLQDLLTKEAYFKLNFTNKASLYQHKGTKKMASDTENALQISFLKSFGGGDGIFYYHRDDKKTEVQKHMLGDLYLISYNLPDWKLLNETKKIGNYTCYKAIQNLKSPITAWYTPEIPVPFGPKTYNGLPGMILEVIMGDIRIFASHVSLNPTEIQNIQKPEKGIKISEEAFNKKLSEFASDIGF
ncbi:GLPGLI family protein [Lacinutrix undariae]